MDSTEIYDNLVKQPLPKNDCYNVFQINNHEYEAYIGKDTNGNVVFMIPSSTPNLLPQYQQTKSLRFAFNQKCVINNCGEEQTMHILLCKENTYEKISAFIRLTSAFSVSNMNRNQEYLSKLFNAISNLFTKDQEFSRKELQGIFGELFTIKYFHSLGLDIASYWQSRDKMKFDFSLDEHRRLEIKTTIKQNRVHHFRHEQLLSNLYDIKVVSIMLRESDTGLSLKSLIEEIREIYSNNFNLMLHIEKVTKAAYYLLEDVCYDEVYLKKNMRFYDAIQIPHFGEKTPDGVYNTEYDCVLDNIKNMLLDDIVCWLKKL